MKPLRYVFALAALFLAQAQAATPPQVVLLLHGMNSGPAVWNDLAGRYFGGFCPAIYDGVMLEQYDAAAAGSLCYRVQFGVYDAAGEDGLENAKAYADQANLPKFGDFSTFEQLGQEVESAVLAIHARHPQAQILLLGHSRGGLAARAFLQWSKARNAKRSVLGLLTTGTPHAGSELGRVYRYIETRLLRQTPTGTVRRQADGRDWNTVDWLNGSAYADTSLGFDSRCGKRYNVDVRRPTINYLTVGSEPLRRLNADLAKLPAWPAYGQMAYHGADMGLLAHKPIEYAIFQDIPGPSMACPTTSTTAENRILSGNAPADYSGDGIVSADSQAALPFASTWTRQSDVPILHIEETKQTADIAAALCTLGFDWLAPCPPGPPAGLRPVPPAAGADEIQRRAAQGRYADMQGWPLAQLWQAWQQANGQGRDATLLGAALAARLQQGEMAPELYRQAAGQLADASLPLTARGRLTGLLGRIATPAALETLLAATEENSTLRSAVLAALEQMGDNSAGRQPALSPLLERAWRAAASDAEYRAAIALALAKIGAPQGIALLLADAGNNNSRAALDELRNPAALALLQQAFSRYGQDEAIFLAAGDGLAALANAEAMDSLLQWARQAPDTARDQALLWLSRAIRDSEARQRLHQRWRETPAFHSPAIAAAIAALLEH
jgi:hypothetical protein